MIYSIEIFYKDGDYNRGEVASLDNAMLFIEKYDLNIREDIEKIVLTVKAGEINE